MTESKNVSVKTIAVALIGAGLLAFIGIGLWKAATPAPTPLQGQVDARTIEVAPKIPGRIEKVLVKEGDTVEAGAVMVKISIPEISAKLGQVTAQEQAAQAKARLVEEGARKEKIREAKSMYESTQGALKLAEKTFSRVNALYKEGLVSAQKFDEAKAALDTARGLARAAQSVYDMALTGSREDEKRAAEALARQAASGVAEVQSLASESLVRAPRQGEVTRVVLHEGEVTPAGFPLVTLLDHSDKWVVFNIREDELAEIKVGTELKAKVPSLGVDNVAFTVYWINPRADYATWRSTRQSTGYDVRTFEVRARPVEPMRDLRPGMSVIVDRAARGA